MADESPDWMDDGIGEKSKSRLKREHHDVKALGEELMGLSRKMLAQLKLPEAVLEDLDAARKLKHGALQRQLRHLANVIVGEDDPARIRAELDRLLRPKQDDIRALHQLERWRDALIAGDESCLVEIAARAPDFDRALVRQLAAGARAERDAAQPPKSARRLYTYLRDLGPPPAPVA
jgi:ribosome-associated protein